jgi:hypothetical protein
MKSRIQKVGLGVLRAKIQGGTKKREWSLEAAADPWVYLETALDVLEK